MAIFIYCKDCEKTVVPNSYGHKKELFRNNTRKRGK